MWSSFPPIPGDGGTLFGIYASSGFLNIIGALEVLGGLCLVIGKYVPLGLTFLTAIMFNAVIFHVLHDMANIGPAVAFFVLCLLNVYAHGGRFKDLLSA